jgi:hypothetical protein
VPGSKAGQVIPYAHSGSRIDAFGFEGDGAIIFWKLRDTKLNTDCSFETNEQGELHCAPIGKAPIMYTDASCGNAVIRAGDSVEFGGYLSAVKRSTLTWKAPVPGELPIHGPVYRYFAYLSDGPTSTPKLYEWDDTQNACVELAIPYPHGVTQELYRVEAKPDSDLTAAQIRTVHLAPGLTLDRIVSSDGAEISGGLKQDDRRCVVQRDGKCVPVPVANASLWLDAACGVRAFTYKAPPPAGKSLYGVEIDKDYVSHVYQLTLLGTADGLSLYNSTPNVLCGAVDSASWHDIMYGPLLDATGDVPALDRRSFGQGRFRPAWFAGTESETDATVLVQVAAPPQFTITDPILVATDTEKVCWIGFPQSDTPQCTYDSSSDAFPLTKVKM